MESIFITGASGFIGSYFCRDLVKKKYKAFGLMRRECDISIFEDFSPVLLNGDLSDINLLYKYLTENNISIVVHAAAYVSDWGDKGIFYNTNVLGTENILEACKRAKIKSFIYISTIDVIHYIRKRHNILFEETPHTKSEHYYQLTKKVAEIKALNYSQYFKVITIRPAWVFGPRDRILFPEIINYLRKGILPLPGKGDAYIPLVYVENLSKCLVDVIEQIEVVSNSSKINIADGVKIKWNELIEILKEEFNPKCKIIHIPYFIYYFLASIIEFIYIFFHIKKRPPLTTISVPMIASSIEINNNLISIYSKSTKINFQDAISKTIEWFKMKI